MLCVTESRDLYNACLTLMQQDKHTKRNRTAQQGTASDSKGLNRLMTSLKGRSYANCRIERIQVQIVEARSDSRIEILTAAPTDLRFRQMLTDRAPRSVRLANFVLIGGRFSYPRPPLLSLVRRSAVWRRPNTRLSIGSQLGSS